MEYNEEQIPNALLILERRKEVLEQELEEIEHKIAKIKGVGNLWILRI